MKKVIQAKLVVDNTEKDRVLFIMKRFNDACNYLSLIAHRERIFYWLKLQRRAYHEIKNEFGLTASEITVAIRKVAYAYRIKENRRKIARFSSLGAIPLWRHAYKNNILRFYGIKIPFVAKKGLYFDKHPRQATLAFINGKFIVHQIIEVEPPLPYEPVRYLGCDLGIKNILVDDEGKIYSGGKLNNIRKRQIKLRARLSKKGTRSARRLLKKRKRKESRYSRDVNHQISKNVVGKAISASFGIALEDLNHLRDKDTKCRKADRATHHDWSFHQLQKYIRYKAMEKGVPVVLVDPRNTSRTCPICGYVAKRNRKSQAWFECAKCGFGHHADTVAAIIIGRRADSNQPYAPSQEAVRVPLKGTVARRAMKPNYRLTK
jgi:IS605 OrfB family transposase